MSEDNKKILSEKIYSAITNIDDSLIEEAENYTLPQTTDDTVVESEVNRTPEKADTPEAKWNTLEQVSPPAASEKKHKNPKKYILMAACFTIIVIIAIPVISKFAVSDTEKSNAPKSSISDEYAKDNGKSRDLTDNGKVSNDKNAESEIVQSAAANGPIEEKNGLTLNSYTGHGLDGSSYGTKEIFSTMKSSTLPTYGECYIVAVNNETTGEVIKIFSATGYELKMAFAGNSLDDVLEKFDIN